MRNSVSMPRVSVCLFVCCILVVLVLYEVKFPAIHNTDKDGECP